MMTASIRQAGDELEGYYRQMQTERNGQLEDYYSKEARSFWAGGASRVMGLTGQEVASKDFFAASNGILPDGSGSVKNAGADNRRAGIDCTFSAPKSVSIAWAQEDERGKAIIEQAMQRSVVRAIEFAERHAGRTRSGAGGVHQQTAKLLASCYIHNTNRNLDPQLHVHAFVHNVVMSGDGRARTLDAGRLLHWQKAIGAGFRCELAQEMSALGYTIQRDGESFRLREVPTALEDEFSSRRSEALAALRETGTAYSSASMQTAVLSTRAPKKILTAEELESSWRQRIEEVRERTVLEAEPEEEPRRQSYSERNITLTDKDAVFSEAKAYAESLKAMQGVGDLMAGERDAVAYLTSQGVQELDGGQRRLFTTADMLRMEHKNKELGDVLKKRAGHRVDAGIIKTTIKATPSLSREQRKTISHICQSGDIALIQGVAGAGKTFALKAAADIYKQAGYEVYGLAPSGKAAEALQTGAEIETRTITKQMLDIYGGEVKERNERTGREETYLYQAKPDAGWDRKQVWIVDEAGMVSTQQMHQLLKTAEDAHAKLVLVGDTKQLQSIQAGAPFRALQERLGFASLDTIRRQRDAQDRRIVKLVRAGRSVEAMKALSKAGRIHTSTNAKEAKLALARDLALDIRKGVVSYSLAERRSDCRDINAAVRQIRKTEGELGHGIQVETINGTREFARGDRVVLLKNVNNPDRLQEVGGTIKNGYTGTVAQCENGELVIKMDDGTLRHIDPKKYKEMDYGYAITTHKSQGSTYEVSRNFCSPESFGGTEMGYVAVSRAKHETHLYGDRESLIQSGVAWSEEHQKRNALDYPKIQREQGRPVRREADELSRPEGFDGPIASRKNQSVAKKQEKIERQLGEIIRQPEPQRQPEKRPEQQIGPELEPEL